MRSVKRVNTMKESKMKMNIEKMANIVNNCVQCVQCALSLCTLKFYIKWIIFIVFVGGKIQQTFIIIQPIHHLHIAGTQFKIEYAEIFPNA